MNQKAMYMADWIAKLDDFLKLSDRQILTHAGRVSHDEATAKAELEYDRFAAARGPSIARREGIRGGGPRGQAAREEAAAGRQWAEEAVSENLLTGPSARPDLLTALCRSRPGRPFREHDRARSGASTTAPAFSAARAPTTPRTPPTRRSPRTLALSRRSPASCLAGLLLTAPPPPVGGGGRMAPEEGFEPPTRRLTAACSAPELLRNGAAIMRGDPGASRVLR